MNELIELGYVAEETKGTGREGAPDGDTSTIG